MSVYIRGLKFSLQKCTSDRHSLKRCLKKFIPFIIGIPFFAFFLVTSDPKVTSLSFDQITDLISEQTSVKVIQMRRMYEGEFLYSWLEIEIDIKGERLSIPLERMATSDCVCLVVNSERMTGQQYKMLIENDLKFFKVIIVDEPADGWYRVNYMKVKESSIELHYEDFTVWFALLALSGLGLIIFITQLFSYN